MSRDRMLKWSVCAGAAMVAASSAQAAPVEWRVEDGGNGRWYQAVAVQEGVTWSEALAAAEGMGGTLASICSPEENAFVYSLLDNEALWSVSGSHWSGPWIGGRKAPNVSDPLLGWNWTNHDAFDYASWAPFQPNNAGGDQDALHFWAIGGAAPTWQDVQGWASMPGFVVEWTVIPAPGTASLLVLAAAAGARRRRR